MGDEAETIAFSELSAVEQVSTVLGVVFAFAIFAVFFYFVWWKMLRAYIRLPEELAGVRAALERIADAMEQRK